MENYANTATPIMHNLKLSKDLDKHIYDTKMQANYRTLLRKLMYLIV